MSKSEGNFFSLADCIKKFGVDSTRLALADAGDGLDDANFDESVANSAIMRLFVFEKWISTELSKAFPQGGTDLSLYSSFDLWDQIFDNEINSAIVEVRANFEDIKYKLALKNGFYEL